MKRRTFLRLSSAAIASLGLSACGAKPADSTSISSSVPTTDSDADDADAFIDIGLTLEEAIDSSNNLFIHRPNGKFYPLFRPTYYGTSSSPNYSYYQDISTAIMIDNISYHSSYPYGAREKNPLTDNISLLDGDELVYVSSTSLPDSVNLMPVIRSFSTLPIIFEGGNPYREFCTADEILGIRALPSREFFDYDSSYIPADQYQYSDDYLPVGLPGLTINGLSIQDYLQSHWMIPIYYTRYERTSDHVVDTYNYRYIVDLSSVTSFDEEKGLDGILELSESNEENTVTISYSAGTQYHSLTLKSTCLAITYDTSQSYSCPLNLTPNGYAVVDTSILPTDQYGTYAISSSPKGYSLTAAYHFIDIPF